MSKKQPKFKVGDTVYFFELGKIKSGKIERVNDHTDFTWRKKGSERFSYGFNDKGVVFSKSEKKCFKTKAKCAKNSISTIKDQISYYKKNIKNQKKGLKFWINSLSESNKVLDNPLNSGG